MQALQASSSRWVEIQKNGYGTNGGIRYSGFSLLCGAAVRAYAIAHHKKVRIESDAGVLSVFVENASSTYIECVPKSIVQANTGALFASTLSTSIGQYTCTYRYTFTSPIPLGLLCMLNRSDVVQLLIRPNVLTLVAAKLSTDSGSLYSTLCVQQCRTRKRRSGFRSIQGLAMKVRRRQRLSLPFKSQH